MLRFRAMIFLPAAGVYSIMNLRPLWPIVSPFPGVGSEKAKAQWSFAASSPKGREGFRKRVRNKKNTWDDEILQVTKPVVERRRETC